MADRKKVSAIAANRAAVRAGRVEKPNEKKPMAEEFDKPATASDAAPAKKPARDLSDPKTQWSILNPIPLRYTLDLEGGRRPIEVRTEFTLRDEMQRRIGENIESWRALLGIEMMRFNPDAVPGSPVDWAWVNVHREYLDPALMLAHIRDRSRAIIASLATFADVDDDDPTRNAKRKVTPAHIEAGMSQADLAAAILMVNLAAFTASEERKKARTAEAEPD